MVASASLCCQQEKGCGQKNLRGGGGATEKKYGKIAKKTEK